MPDEIPCLLWWPKDNSLTKIKKFEEDFDRKVNYDDLFKSLYDDLELGYILIQKLTKEGYITKFLNKL